MRAISLSLALLLLTPAKSWAAEFHAAPLGSTTGDGTPAAPWDLQTALAHPAALLPGDTLLLHGGIYKGAFSASLDGTESARIIVRSAPGEWARIDLPATMPQGDALSLGGAFTTYRDFEIFCSDPVTPRDSTSVAIGGSHLLLANLVIHDVGNNMFHGEAGEVYGCILYNNGTDGAFLAHHLYTQNDDTSQPCRITDSLIFNGYAFGIHAYATHGFLSGIRVEGNVWFNNGAAQTEGDRKDNCLVGGVDHAPENIVIRDNFGWAASPDNRSVSLGRYNDDNRDLVLEDNYLVGATDFPNAWQSLSMKGNTFIGPVTGAVDAGAWLDNTYLSAPPTDNAIFVRPNREQPGRAHVIVYNWAGNDSVACDLADVLKPGDAFEVRNGQNVLSPPVAKGVYDGAPVSLPMGAGTDPALPLGPGLIEPDERTGTAFNVFVVMASGTVPIVDAGPAPDAQVGQETDAASGGAAPDRGDAGCGCRAARGPRAAPWLAALWWFGLAAVWRRSRRSRRAVRVGYHGPVLALLCAACGGRASTDSDPTMDASGPVDAAATEGIHCTVRDGAVRPVLAFEFLDGDGRELSQVTFRDDGTLLASRSRFPDSSQVFRVHVDGGLERIWGDEDAGAAAPQISPKGDGFLQWRAIHDESGTLLGEIPERSSDAGHFGMIFARYSASGQRLLAEWGTIDLEASHPKVMDVSDRSGALVASFDEILELVQIPASDDAVVGVSGANLVRRTLDGAVAWSVPLQSVMQIALSRDGQDAILEQPHAITHVHQGAVVGSAETTSAVWDIAMNGPGTRSVASLVEPGRVMMFEAGALVRTVVLELKYVNTIAIDDAGEIAIGGKDDAGISHVMLLDPQGELAFDCKGPYDNGGWSPRVVLEGDGAALLVYWRDRLRLDRLDR